MKLVFLTIVFFIFSIAFAQSIEIGVDGQGPVNMSGDVTGSSSLNVVTKLNGTPISSTTPTNAQVLTYNSVSGSWLPATTSSSLPSLTSTNFWVGNGSNIAIAVSSSGDATFSAAGAFKVLALRGVGISTVSPSNSQVLTYNSASSLWAPQTASGGGGSTQGAVTTVTSGSISGSTSAYQRVPLNSCSHDDNSFCGTNIFTAKKTGFHQITCNLGGNSSGNGFLSLAYCINGSGAGCGGGTLTECWVIGTSSIGNRGFCSQTVYMSSGDTISCYVFTNGNGDYNDNGGQNTAFLEF